MPNLNIPDEARPALAQLARLDAGSVTELVRLLEKASLSISLDDLVSEASQQIKTIESGDVRTIVESLRQLAVVKAVAEIPTERFIADVAEAMGVGDDVVLSETEQQTLRGTLKALLAIRSIDTPAKARSLRIENENTFCQARVITDVRPVFGSDVLSPPSTAVIVNTLRLTYHHGPALRSFFVALDRDDLDTLSEILERAKAKTETLHRFLTRAQLEPIDSD
ncbi:MAG: hypothetical protein HY657_15320 [Acidobacteria bacterium]|nr:hypothetical protein [Acidobacteriota bacterium]